MRYRMSEGMANIGEVLKEAMERTPRPKEPEQEPVAWLHWLHGPVRLFLNKDEAMMELDRLNREYPVDKDARQMKPLYTTPPQRTWVGLTEDEIDQGLLRTNYAMQTAKAWRDGVAWAYRQLKEKNT